MRRSLLIALPMLGLAGCAYVPFLHTRHNYVVFFQPNSATLQSPAIAAIAKAAEAAKTVPGLPVTVTGAADTDGTTPDNIRLSNARATTVAAQLGADGVAGERITARGIGAVGSPPGSEQASRTATIHIGF